MDTTFKPDPGKIHFIPLGGSEEFGVNFNLYAYRGKWLAIDCGMGFADERFPGVDIILPDPAFIEERRKDLAGLIITHAHEDHIGAVMHLWPRLKCPIFCSPFTAAVLKRKFKESPDCKKAEINIVRAGESREIGPFTARFVHVSHSIPDSCAIFLETDQGVIVHSGDWNLDPTPVLRDPTDEAAFRSLGGRKVLAYVGDSTNAAIAGRTGSEADVAKGLEALFRESRGRIAVTVFASNIGRIHSICTAAEACGRDVALIGRSLHTMTGAARDCGYLKGIKQFISEEDIGYLPNERQILIITGSQGEARAALSRIARGENREVSLGRGDTVIFSARAIPGNEKDINAVKNNLVGAGVKVIDPDTTPHTIHVSGHPRRGEIADMLSWVRPVTVIPVHGERLQLEAHKELALSCQVKHAMVPNNGSVIALEESGPLLVTHVTTGILAVEPGRTIPGSHAAIAERRKLQYSGVLHATVALSARGDMIADPQISSSGLIAVDDPEDAALIDELTDEVEDIIADMRREDRMNDHMVQEEIRIGLRRYVNMVLKIKPKTTVHVIRV